VRTHEPRSRSLGPGLGLGRERERDERNERDERRAALPRPEHPPAHLRDPVGELVRLGDLRGIGVAPASRDVQRGLGLLHGAERGLDAKPTIARGVPRALGQIEHDRLSRAPKLIRERPIVPSDGGHDGRERGDEVVGESEGLEGLVGLAHAPLTREKRDSPSKRTSGAMEGWRACLANPA